MIVRLTQKHLNSVCETSQKKKKKKNAEIKLDHCDETRLRAHGNHLSDWQPEFCFEKKWLTWSYKIGHMFVAILSTTLMWVPYMFTCLQLANTQHKKTTAILTGIKQKYFLDHNEIIIHNPQVVVGWCILRGLANTFTLEFLKWAHPYLNLDTSIVANRGFSWESITEWQTVWILMRRLITSSFISIWIVCQCSLLDL